MDNGIPYFLECCRNEAVSCDLFCTGSARKETLAKRYKFDTSNKLKPLHKYAIEYIPHKDFFICWNAQIKNRKVYSVSKERVHDALEQNQLIVKKGIEFKWRTQEDVYVFKQKDTSNFLEYLKQKL